MRGINPREMSNENTIFKGFHDEKKDKNIHSLNFFAKKDGVSYLIKFIGSKIYSINMKTGIRTEIDDKISGLTGEICEIN